MNKRSCTLLMLCWIILSAKVEAETTTRNIIEGQTVEETVLVRPRLGTLIEFPENIQRAFLGDKTLFACEQSGSNIVCTAKGKEGTKSNLTVITRQNRYMLTLINQASVLHDAITFKYGGNTTFSIKARPASNYARDLLKKFDVKKIGRKTDADDLVFDISQIAFLGPNIFMFFSVQNRSSNIRKVAGVEMEVLTRAYLTGLPVQTNKVGGVITEMDKAVVNPGEEVRGIAVLPRLEISSSQELTFTLSEEGKQTGGVKIENIRF
ncbi:MAG: hypothetical protein Q7T03_03580 [Deltaproteobacteria bacterium]|nr:hypothetical protein [Deltaproteobacteria bacterium]